MIDPEIQCVRDWLSEVVIGLNLCPFAGGPFRAGLVRMVVSHATTDAELLADLDSEMQLLDRTPSDQLETTLIVIPGMLADFGDYNQFLDQVDRLLRRKGYAAEYQVASFHPRYQFADTEPDDPGNLTNRAPFPILHILREASIDEAVANYPDINDIPARNIDRMKSLTRDEIASHFPWISLENRELPGETPA